MTVSLGHRCYHYASTALMDPMTKAFVAGIHGFVAARGLELDAGRAQRAPVGKAAGAGRAIDPKGIVVGAVACPAQLGQRPAVAAVTSGSAVKSAVAVSRKARMEPMVSRHPAAMMIETVVVVPPPARTEAKTTGARSAPIPEIW
ncbi:hypothetical protein [Pseudonocardia sp. H11422]|uniref:hypothetical protein n=1 Tax=Pseudonocardia sp. H11422 TaxID=2835866 RepID=UPI001BDCC6EB|nr:hypothetical protein [Pseudonocardia sp. H11422]